MPTLGKTWQILLKGLGEVQSAPTPQSAAEMVIIRLSYAADLPDPADLLKRLKDQGESFTETGGGPPQPSMSQPETTPVARSVSGGSPVSVPQPQPASTTETALHSFEDVIAVLENTGEVLLAGNLYHCAHLVKFEQGRIEIRPSEKAPQKMTQDLGKKLGEITNQRWVVSVSGAAGQPTLAQQLQALKDKETAEILQMPIIREVMQAFPDAELLDIEKAE